MKDTKLALLIAAILIMLAALTREDPAASEEATAAVVPITYADKRGADRRVGNDSDEILQKVH